MIGVIVNKGGETSVVSYSALCIGFFSCCVMCRKFSRQFDMTFSKKTEKKREEETEKKETKEAFEMRTTDGGFHGLRHAVWT